MDNCKDVILSQLTPEYRRLFEPVSFSDLEEIRFRINRPVMLYAHSHPYYLSASGGKTVSETMAKVASRTDMNALSASFCSSSVYAFLNDIKDGFITMRGGHRVGLAGKSIIKNGDITNITDISGINLRIAKSYTGCGEELAKHLRAGTTIKNTLLIAPPQCGKTTLLRDLARIFSQHFKIVIVDERSEIAGTYEGEPQFDVGPQTDVLDRFPKAMGMLLAVRSLSPQIIITDELGSEADVKALQNASCTGCRLIASIHGDSPETLHHTKQELLTYFDVAVILGRKNNRPAILQIKDLR